MVSTSQRLLGDKPSLNNPNKARRRNPAFLFLSWEFQRDDGAVIVVRELRRAIHLLH